jgi:cholesterol oxidase
MTYSVRFTEKMIGAFTFGEHDYQAGYRSTGSAGDAGHAAGGALMFRLTIATEDMDGFLADPTHPGVAHAYVESDVLGGRRPVEAGLFNLFVDDGPATRHMLYRLYFSDSTGRPLTLAGFKNVKPGPLTKVWPETSTLYVRVLSGHIPVADGGESADDGVVGSGILRIRPVDFAWQLSTFRASGPSLSGRGHALDSFGRLFLSELWQVFDPFRPGSHRGT